MDTPSSRQNFRRRSWGGVVATVGFLLSPLSWWNDPIVNIPLALGFAWAVSWFYREAFAASFVVGYWLTNIIGLVLLQRGGEALLGRGPSSSRRRQLLRDLAISLLYTAAIIALIKFRIFAPPPEYIAPVNPP